MTTTHNFEALDRPFIHPDDMPDVFALRGYGTCMEPLVADGSLLVCDKRKAPQVGDTVSLIFTEEAAHRNQLPGMIKRLVSPVPPLGLDARVIVEQLNPPRRYAIPTADLLAVHKVVGFAQSSSEGKATVRRELVEA